MKATTLAGVLSKAAGHGNLVWPLTRNNKGCEVVETHRQFPGSYGMAIEWYQHWCGVGMTECDPSRGNGQTDGDKSRHPGSDPGMAPVMHPCSAAYGDEHHFTPFTSGYDCGSTVWTVNSTVEVISAINNNHGGYYQFRLCPLVDKDYAGMQEADCEKNVIEFASKQVGVKPQFSGKTLPGGPPSSYITADDRAGRKDGSMWRNVNFARTDGSLYVDQLRVPDLADGKYVLQWRWDCIETAQVWTSCADITLWNGAPSPSPVPAPTPSGSCHAVSVTVTDDWCKTNCLFSPPNCPSSLCSCDGAMV